MRHDRSSRSGAAPAGRRFDTRVALARLAIATWVTFAGWAGAPYCSASDLTIDVLDRQGHGVEQVVATLMPAAGAPSVTPRPAVMDQKDQAFVPRILVVNVGANVEFPNSDSVSHQVYSFSAAKRFQLPLYKGEAHPPVTFDRPGLVVLGCNIHDSMVGYIYVTPAPYFGTTDTGGSVTLRDLPRGDYRVTIWSPYIADNPAGLTRDVHVDGGASAQERFQLAVALRSLPEPKPKRRDWDY
jgi:plastocyanin